MEKWLIELETTRPEHKDFNALLEKEIGLIKLTGVIAKEIILAAKNHNTEINLVYEAVGAWIKRIGDAGIEINSVKN